MRAIRIHDFGGPEVLKQDNVPLPQPEDDQVLVRVHAASVNPVDYKTREGKFPAIQRDALPITLGRDLSGTIETCGTRVSGTVKGDAVFALLGSERGAYAQYVMVKATEYAPKPRRLTHVEAAAVPLAALTAWQGLFQHGRLAAGQRVLIHGGAGGVGHFAVQLAKAHGAWVAATCAGEDAIFVRRLGADTVIDYRTERFEEKLSGLDLVYDLIGGETQERSFAVLKEGGALISTLQEPDRDKARQKTLRAAHYMAQPDAAQLAEIGRMIDAGEVTPHVARVLPLEEAARAETMLAKDHIRGKIVLAVVP